MAKLIANGTHRNRNRYVLFRFYDDGLVQARVDNERQFAPWTAAPVKLSYVLPLNEELFNSLFGEWTDA